LEKREEPHRKTCDNFRTSLHTSGQSPPLGRSVSANLRNTQELKGIPAELPPEWRSLITGFTHSAHDGTPVLQSLLSLWRGVD